MNTIVAKGNHLSLGQFKALNKTLLKIDVNLVFIHPSGKTTQIITNEQQFRDMIELEDTIIFDNN